MCWGRAQSRLRRECAPAIAEQLRAREDGERRERSVSGVIVRITLAEESAPKQAPGAPSAALEHQPGVRKESR
jgi:hypothetical protein